MPAAATPPTAPVDKTATIKSWLSDVVETSVYDDDYPASIFFNADSATYVSSEASAEVYGKVAQFYKSHPGVTFRLEGHVRDLNSSSGNLQLAQDRANKVSQELTSRGIPSSAMTVNAQGTSAGTSLTYADTSDRNVDIHMVP
jgi:outer membrane protein OmpA-like peptidoglycan-associated protein